MPRSALSPRRRPVLATAIVTLIGLGLFAAVISLSEAGKGMWAGLASRALSTPTSHVSIGRIEGLLSGDVTIQAINVADRDGTWLTADRVQIRWRRLALLWLKLEIDRLEVDRMDIQRQPLLADEPTPGSAAWRLPDLPLAVEIRRLALARADVGEPVLGVGASFSAEGNAKLGSSGLDLGLAVKRLDRPTTLDAQMSFVQRTQALRARLKLDEAQGGIIAEIAGLPGRPPVKLDLDGSGTLDDFQAALVLDAGEETRASGKATLARDGAARKLSLDLAAQAEHLLPDLAAPLFAGTTSLTGQIAFGDDGAIHVPSLALVGQALRLDIGGTLSAARIADITISGANIPNSENGTVIRNAAIKDLALEARVTGALHDPSIDASLTVETMRLPSISLGSLSANFEASPAQGPANATTPSSFRADATVKRLALADPALAEAIGNALSLSIRGTGTFRGPLDIEESLIKTPTLSAGFKGRAGASDLKGRLEAEAPSLSRFGKIAGLKLEGTGKLSADVEGAPEEKAGTARIDAEASGFATGIAPVDALIGGKLRLAGGLRHDPDGGFGFEDFRLTGERGGARISGAATPETADVAALLIVPSLAKVDKRLSGRGELTAKITGSLGRPDATATLVLSEASMLGRSVPHLKVEADATDLTGALEARLRLTANMDGKPAQGTLRVARPQAGGTSIDEMDLVAGSVAIKGAVALDAEYLATGQISVRAGNLDDLSPLLLQKLSGQLDADVSLASTGSRQDLAVKANGHGVEAFGIGFGKLAADLAVSDLYRRPMVSGSASADEARIGTETISRLRLNAQGTGEASDIALTASARGADLEARARVLASDPLRITFSKLDARRGRTRISLAGPATITIKDGGADLQAFALSTNGGRLSIEGRAGQDLDLKVNARAVPLSVADIVLPELGLGGTLDGEAAILGTAAAPSGSYRFRIEAMVASETKAAGLPPMDMTASGRLEGTQASIDATVTAGKAGSLRLLGSAPLTASGPLDLALKGSLDAGFANVTLAAAGRRVTGTVAVDGRVTGTLDQPRAAGSATLTHGSFQDAFLGTRLDGIRARVLAQGDKLTIESASGTARNGGAITAAGDVRLDPAGGFPGTVTIRGQGAEIVRSSLATAVVDLDLGMTGPLARFPRLGGKIGIRTLDIAIPDRLSGPGQPLDGTRHLHPTPTAARRLAIAAKTRREPGAPAFDAALDLTLDVPGRIRVTGRGLDAQLGGSLKLLGTLAEPKPVGAFNLVQGRMRILTSQLDFIRANLTFAGDLSPQLDFLAATQAGGASITVAVTGNPSDPQFTFSSSPDLPQDEILARLLFGQSAGQLTPTQALTLAQAVAIYSGGTTALEGLRRSLGLGDTSRSDNPLTNWLGDRVSVGVRTGATPAQTGVGVDISIWKQFKARGTIDARGGASVGAGAEYEW